MQERELFHTALEHQDPRQRAAFLDEACGQDAELRQRLEELLDAHKDAGSFLEKTPAELAGQSMETEVGQTSAGSNDTADWLNLLEPSNHPGSVGAYGSYHIMELIGRGGFGVVLRAHDPQLDRTVAVKLLNPEIAANPTSVRHFVREARAAAAISHDHVVTIHAIDEDRHPPMIVMEFVAGQSLEQKIDRVGVLDVLSILRIGLQTASALSAAHRQGLVHRDIKPANILLENGIERVKLTDFGLARAVDDIGLTQTSQIAGTPQYMSPEQAQGQRVDPRTDLFSLGCVLYAACTGRAAFRGHSAVAVLHQVVHETPRPIREINEEIPDWLCEIVSKLMEKDPERRFQSAEELQDLITRHLTHLQQPDRVPQPGPISSEVRPAGDSNATVTQRQSSVETLLAFWMTPQRGYARFVSIPCLILLGVWISVFLGAVVADADEATQVVLFLAGFTGLPLAFTILTLFWSRSPARLGPETEKSVSVVADVPFTVMERVLSCGMTPQPGFIRRVSVPCLILLGVLLITFVVSVALDPVQFVRWWSHVLTASLIGIAILFMVLTALWARSRARPGLPMPVVALTVMGMTVCLPLARVSYLVFQGRASSESNDSRPEMYSTNDGVSARDESSAIAVELTMHQWYSRSLAETTIESSVLRAGFSRLYIDYLVSTGQDVSGEAEFEEKLSRMIDGLRSISPQFLCVSPEQETAFATEGLNAVVDFTRRPEDGHHYMLATLAEARSGFLPLTSFAVANSSDRRRTLLETHALAQLLAVEIERSKFATGLRSEPIEKPGPQEGEELTASKVLRNGFDRILEGFPTKNGPDQSLEKVKVSEIKLLQRIAQLRDVYPAFLNTSAQQERRFELGEFDEVSTLQSIRKTLQTLEDFGVELHPLTVYVVEQYRADGYRGVQLEVTKHLLDFERANLNKNLK